MPPTSTLTLEGDATTGGVPPGGDVLITPPEEPSPRRLRVRIPERRPVGLMGDAAGVLAVLVLGFLFTLLVIGPFREARDQEVLYSQFRGELANATAPVSQLDFEGALVRPGAPVALLTIPSIGLKQVIVEGTTSANLRSGPGHRRDTVLPGQSGVSLVMGRQAAYGAPFGELTRLKPGDTITALTGQGTSTYVVRDVRLPGDLIPPALSGTQGRLTLMTAGGTPYLPDHVVRVDADLSSAPMATPGRAFGTSSLVPAELTMHGDTENVFALVLWSQALLIVTLAFAWIRTRWGRRQAWTVGVPVLIALGVTVSDLVAQLLPNLM